MIAISPGMIRQNSLSINIILYESILMFGVPLESKNMCLSPISHTNAYGYFCLIMSWCPEYVTMRRFQPRGFKKCMKL